MALGEERLCSIIESLLMITPEPLPIQRLVEVILIEDPQTQEEGVRSAIRAVVERYQDAERPLAKGFMIAEMGGALQIRTVPENAPYVRRFLAAKPQRLSKPALETLAIIAYRQPVTKPEIESIRGVDVTAALKGLLDHDFIRILGKRDEVGRPLIYGTSDRFLEFFGLRGLGELPTLREYHELDEEHQQEVDSLYQDKISDLAQAASFLVDREDDPDLDALDKAVQDADRVRRSADLALDPAAEPKEDEPKAEEAQKDAASSEKTEGDDGAKAKEAEGAGSQTAKAPAKKKPKRSKRKAKSSAQLELGGLSAPDAPESSGSDSAAQNESEPSEAQTEPQPEQDNEGPGEGRLRSGFVELGADQAPDPREPPEGDPPEDGRSKEENREDQL